MSFHRFRAPLLGVLAALSLPAGAAAQQVFLKHLWVNDPNFVCSANAVEGQLSCTFSTQPDIAGNISNNPHIEFDQDPRLPVGLNPALAECQAAVTATGPQGSISRNICNYAVALCTEVGYSNQQVGNGGFALDFISFEVFKFQEGSNPLDPQSTPPVRTFFVDNPGFVPAGATSDTNPLPEVCVLWDGDINIRGEFGKSNGQYGFRATVATNQTGANGNINITQTRAYPGSFTEDADGERVDQKPIIVDVANVHVVRTSPTVVGDLTGVAAEPYNITYRLAKDATTYITIHESGVGLPVVRSLVPGQPRVGEGIPNGALQNGDSWNGRFENGGMGRPGVYLATIQSLVRDQWGTDISKAVTRQISLDPLQITDIRTQPLTDLSTSLAVLSYVLTEPATVYVDIYPPGTQFSSLNSLNSMTDTDPTGGSGAVSQNLASAGVLKNFVPTLAGGPVLPIRHMEEQKDFRRPVITFWDGRDSTGRVMPDGDYVFVVYSAMPSPNGYVFRGDANDRRIWSTNARSGFLSISRGYVTISQVGPSSTVIGSTPAVAALDPFTFTYSLSREALVSLKIFDHTGTSLIKTLIDNEVRPGNFLNRERWQAGVGDDGLYISSGNYLVQLTAADPFFPSKISTTTALFPVNLFRITDVQESPLLTGATDIVTISYQLSQAMNVAWHIYPPGTVISGSSGTWPPCGLLEPGACSQITQGGTPAQPLITIKGMRPGRLRITEFWDGRDQNGLFVPDGNYVYTLVAQSSTTPKFFAADKITGILTVARGSIVFPVFNITPTFPTLFNSSQTISLPPYEIDYSLTRQSSVTIQIFNTSPTPQLVRTLISGQVRDANILNREFWDARDDRGNFVASGFYIVRAVAEDLASILSSGSTAQQTISVDPLRIYDVAISPLRADFGTALIAYQVSETMKVAIKIYKPGTTFDSAGNPSPPDSQSLVKRIVGVRPARTEITEIWDGTDESLSVVTDGNYIFKIVASTDINAIETASGNVRPGAALAEDLIIAEIPVVRGGAGDPAAAFENNSFVFPNPLRDPTATFRIYVPLQAKVLLKLYNIAGDLVLDKDFGSYAQDSYVEFPWDKTNQAGRRLAPGVYFALIREEAERGEKQFFQTVKKLLIP